MVERATSSSDLAAILTEMKTLGEMKAKIQELVHQNAHRGLKDDATSRIIVKLEDTPDRLTKIEDRLSSLETDKVRRETERGFIATVIASPLFQWAGTIALAAYVWWKGQGQ